MHELGQRSRLSFTRVSEALLAEGENLSKELESGRESQRRWSRSPTKYEGTLHLHAPLEHGLRRFDVDELVFDHVDASLLHLRVASLRAFVPITITFDAFLFWMRDFSESNI